MKYRVLILLLLTGVACAQEDTASVTYIPSLDIYLLQYTAEGISYGDTLVPSTRIDPKVKCSVEMVESLYVYSYSVSLSPESQQYLVSFMVSHLAPVISPTKPNARWTYGELARYKVSDWSNTRMDPSGLWSPTTDVAPGGSLGGFSFKSTGLPIVVYSYFEGNAPLLSFSAEPPALIDHLLDSISAFPNNTVPRQTLGAKDPPTPFNALTFLDTLISYKHQARSLGWIDSDGIATSLNQKLDNARRQLQRGNTTSARNILRAFINEVEAQNGRHLTSEAYALLKFNAEYLITRL